MVNQNDIRDMRWGRWSICCSGLGHGRRGLRLCIGSASGFEVILNVLAILCDEVRCCYYTIVGTNDFLIHPVSLLRHSQIDYTNIETVIEFDDGFSAFILLDFRAAQMRKGESAYNILNYALK